jgi:putative oxidoreductase
MLVLGYKTRWAALSLSGFCILATVLYHNQFAKQTEVIQFLTDFTLAGVLLFLFAYGPGPLSLDVRHNRGRLAHQRERAVPQRA